MIKFKPFEFLALSHRIPGKIEKSVYHLEIGNRDLKHRRRMGRRRQVKLLQDWVEDVVHGVRVHVNSAESLQTST